MCPSDYVSICECKTHTQAHICICMYTHIYIYICREMEMPWLNGCVSVLRQLLLRGSLSTDDIVFVGSTILGPGTIIFITTFTHCVPYQGPLVICYATLCCPIILFTAAILAQAFNSGRLGAACAPSFTESHGELKCIPLDLGFFSTFKGYTLRFGSFFHF